jgi:anti-anti-sigma factor
VVAKYLEEGPANIVLDLAKIDFVDSSGVGALVQISKLVQGQSGILQLVGNARVTQTLKLVRLDKFLPQQTSVEEAVEAIKAAQGDRI